MIIMIVLSNARAAMTRSWPLTYRSPKTEIRESPIHGRGIFAMAPIAKGETVAVKGGHVMTAREWEDVEPNLGSSEVQIDDDLFIGPVTVAERDGAMVYTNHSCEPNIAIRGQIVFVAMRDIAAGEELTHDWATTDAGDYRMLCNCGASTCRGTVTGRDWMKPELQRKYAGWFCWYVQKRIDALDQNR